MEFLLCSWIKDPDDENPIAKGESTADLIRALREHCLSDAPCQIAVREEGVMDGHAVATCEVFFDEDVDVRLRTVDVASGYRLDIMCSAAEAREIASLLPGTPVAALLASAHELL